MSCTTCHQKTQNLQNHVEDADLLISATGKHNLIQSNRIKKNSIILDCGINLIDNKIEGDLKYNDIVNKVKYINPVP